MLFIRYILGCQSGIGSKKESVTDTHATLCHHAAACGLTLVHDGHMQLVTHCDAHTQQAKWQASFHCIILEPQHDSSSGSDLPLLV